MRTLVEVIEHGCLLGRFLELTHCIGPLLLVHELKGLKTLPERGEVDLLGGAINRRDKGLQVVFQELLQGLA